MKHNNKNLVSSEFSFKICTAIDKIDIQWSLFRMINFKSIFSEQYPGE